MEKNIDALMQAHDCYMALGRYRHDRERNKRYNYGDQWSDMITVDGQKMREEEYIRQQGSEPLKNNMIRRLVRNVIGVFSSQLHVVRTRARSASPGRLNPAMDMYMHRNGTLNHLDVLYARSLEEFLLGGLVVHRKWYGVRNGRAACWTDYVHPNNFFVDSNMRDFRSWDCGCIGEVHDVDFGTLCAQLARSSDDYATLRAIYEGAAERNTFANRWHDFGYPSQVSMSFLVPKNPAMCRVIELWRKEYVARYRCHDPRDGYIYKIDAADYDRVVTQENARRDSHKIRAMWTMDEEWHYYYLSPFGDVLAHGVTPYAHGGHPYVVKAYPMIDGEIHAFVSDIIDQQRYTNRLITLYDWTIRASAKGVLLVPDECLPKGLSPADFADAWSRFNGVMVYHPSARGDTPRQVSSNIANGGIAELLNIQLKFFEEISGVSSALQGKLANSAMSADLYGQQTRNATMVLLDLLNTFRDFMRDCACKDLCNMQQFSQELSDELRRTEFEVNIAQVPC